MNVKSACTLNDVLIVLTVLRYWMESEGPPNDSFVGFVNEVKHEVFVLT